MGSETGVILPLLSLGHGFSRGYFPPRLLILQGRPSAQLQLSPASGNATAQAYRQRILLCGPSAFPIRILALPFIDLRSHWRFLSRGMVPTELGFNRLHLVSGQRIDCGRTRVEAERPVRGLFVLIQDSRWLGLEFSQWRW